jgi:uncharacterized protein (DUF433 family)
LDMFAFATLLTSLAKILKTKTANPNIPCSSQFGRMNGQPCIRNMRLTVRRVVELAATYPNREELQEEYPKLEDEDIRQALLYAATYLDDRIVDLPTSHETTVLFRQRTEETEEIPPKP